MAIALKDDSVHPRGITAELLLGILVAEGVYHEYGKRVTLTSLNDGRHGEASAHYEGNATDLRIWGIEHLVNEVADKMRSRLNRHYDVVVEKDHIHLEYDPKRPVEND